MPILECHSRNGLRHETTRLRRLRSRVARSCMKHILFGVVALIVYTTVVFALISAELWLNNSHAQNLKLVAEPEQRILDMRIHGNKFLEIRWNDADAGRPQDVEVRTTYKPIVSVHEGAWKITFERP